MACQGGVLRAARCSWATVILRVPAAKGRAKEAATPPNPRSRAGSNWLVLYHPPQHFAFLKT
jgi:hypothetical protein